MEQICKLCGKKTKLSFEHIPPKSAHNKNKVKTYNGIHLICREEYPWVLDNLPYKQSQKGVGLYSLCQRCNNNTGTWYGSEYTKFVNAVLGVLKQANNIKSNGFIQFKLFEFKPLAVFKQIMSFFCSTNNYSAFDDELRSFVMTPESNQFDDVKYRVYMYLLDPKKQNHSSWTGLMTCMRNDGKIYSCSEVVVPPFGYLIRFNDKKEYDYKECDITNFAKYEYSAKYDCEFLLRVFERNTLFPADYRTKEEIISEVKLDKENGGVDLK